MKKNKPTDELAQKRKEKEQKRKEERKRKMTEYVKFAKKIHKKNAKNFKPNHDWLKKNGYANLNYALIKYPELFVH